MIKSYSTLFLGAVLLAGCGEMEVVHSPQASVASPVMDAACIAAVQAETNNPQVRAISAVPMGRSTTINLLVGPGDAGTWSCVVYEDGYVDTVTFTGTDGGGGV